MADCTSVLSYANPDCIAQKAASGAVQAFTQYLGNGCVDAIKFMESFWLKVPSPQIASGGGGSWVESPVIGDLQRALSPFTAVVAVVCFAVALARVGLGGRVGEGTHAIGRQLVAVVASSLAVAALTELLIQAGDAFAPWIVDQASQGGASGGLSAVMAASVATANSGLWLVLFLLAALGALAQCVFMVIRGAALIVLMVFLPPTAAGAASDEGWLRLKRLFMLLLGFVLFKPVAAVIYAVGLKLITGDSGSVMNAVYGLAIVVMSAVALPAFIRFLMPAAAMGSSSAFSGGAAIGAVAATGAAVVSLGAGGAGAAGAGSGAGGGAAGGAGTAAANGAGPSGGSDPAHGGGGGGGSGSAAGHNGIDDGGDSGRHRVGADATSGGGGAHGPSGSETAGTTGAGADPGTGAGGGGSGRGLAAGASAASSVAQQIQTAGDEIAAGGAGQGDKA